MTATAPLTLVPTLALAPGRTVLGLDMSSTCIGYALAFGEAIERWGHIDLDGEIAARCDAAACAVDAMLARYRPELVVIESPVARFAKSVIPQARVSGAVLLALHRRRALWAELTPGQGKQALAEDGAATKQEMVDAACARLGLPRGDIRKRRGKVWAFSLIGKPLLSEDDADAIALALAGLAVKVAVGGAL